MSRAIRQQLDRTRKEREAEARKRDRAAISQLRTHVRDARRTSRKNCRRALKSCTQLRRLVMARKRAALAQARADIEREAITALTRARQDCEGRKARCMVGGESRVARAVAALEAEREFQRQMGRGKERKRMAAPAARRAEVQSESDSEVEASIPPELVIVWRKVKRRITATPHRSRLESFLEWVESHRAEVQEIYEQDVEQYVRELSAREAELREREGEYGHMPDAQLDQVPF